MKIVTFTAGYLPKRVLDPVPSAAQLPAVASMIAKRAETITLPSGTRAAWLSNTLLKESVERVHALPAMALDDRLRALDEIIDTATTAGAVTHVASRGLIDSHLFRGVEALSGLVHARHALAGARTARQSADGAVSAGHGAATATELEALSQELALGARADALHNIGNYGIRKSEVFGIAPPAAAEVATWKAPYRPPEFGVSGRNRG